MTEKDVKHILEIDVPKMVESLKTKSVNLRVFTHSLGELKPVGVVEYCPSYVVLRLHDPEGTVKTDLGFSQPIVYVPYDEIIALRVEYPSSGPAGFGFTV